MFSLPKNEQERLASLSEYKILDTRPEQEYDDIVKIIAHICDVPIALIALLDQKRKWHKAKCGTEATGSPREITICSYTITQSETLIIPDTHLDNRFNELDVVTKPPYVRFYAGVPLINKEGYAIGTLCLIDTKPNTLTSQQQESLEAMARQVLRLLESRRMTFELEKQKDKAESADKAKTVFLSHMSHELRSPLNAILGFSQLLETDNEHPLSSVQKDSTNEIKNAGNHLLELINNLLDISQIEAGEINLNLTNLNLLNVVNNAVKQIMLFADEQQIQIQSYSILSTLEVKADAIRLHQILLNLLSNAVKYNSVSGTIQISYNLLTDGFIRIAVKDTSSGLSEQQQSQLFKSFNRINQESTIEGTGLGLIICRQLIEAMGGKIGVESQPGQGSSFWIDIPTHNT